MFLGKLLKLTVPYFASQEKGHAIRIKKANLAKQLEECPTVQVADNQDLLISISPQNPRRVEV